MATYAISLHSIDGLDDINPVETFTRRNGDLVTVYVYLPPKRLWELTLVAHGCQNVTITLLPCIELSKLDYTLEINFSTFKLQGKVPGP